MITGKRSLFFLANRITVAVQLCLSAGLLISCANKNGRFVKLEASHTGISFSNTITENDSVNVFDFANIYNGGGVGIGDFNSDGLQDVYFTGNMVANKLYLNKGAMKFEDVTVASQTDGKGEWCRGVSVVDINNDGRQDIYVCATAKRDAQQRKNILYINQGNDKAGVPQFKDEAKAYGLDDTTQSTMAYFFDYDNDNDLDLYIAVNHIIQNEYTNNFRKRNLNGEHPSTGKLYRNDWNDSLRHPYYTDVSRGAGILVEGYSHAANIFDANNDGWQDILVLNDYISSNVLYINNRNGTFTDSVMHYFKHTAANSMGSDAVDINNDGWDDVVEVDMLPQDNFRKKMFQSPNSYQTYQNSDVYGYQYQYVRNMVQLNLGPSVGSMDSIRHPLFADVGFYAGIAETDWSWTPLVADYDNDGWRDIVFTNGFPKDVTDHDFIAFRREAANLVTKQEMMKEIPAVKIHDYVYRNNGGLSFTDKSADWGLTDARFSNGAAYADLDNDGDLDVVVNNINDAATVYENRITAEDAKQYLDLRFEGPATNANGIGTRVIVHQKRGIQTAINNPYRGYISSVSPQLHFGLGNEGVDSIEIFWSTQLKQVIRKPALNTTMTVSIKNAGPFQFKPTPAIADNNWFTNITVQTGINYVHEQRDFIDFNIQKLLPHKFSEYGPGIAVGDINGDGLDDFITGAAPNYSAMIFLQVGNGRFSQSSLLKPEEAAQKTSDDRGLLLFDADGDNDQDLYISSGGYAYGPGDTAYADKLYINEGKGVFKINPSALPLNTGSKFCVRACDYDKDGDLDLFVAGRVKPWNYPQPVSSYIYRNDSRAGSPNFTDVTTNVAPSLTNIGLACDAIWTDFDNDGWTDLLLAGEWMPLTFIKNENGRFKDVTTTTGINNKVGWWNSLAAGDFDNDGDVDFIAGNLGENSFYKASDKHPVSVYAKDFDKNGVLECIPTKYILDKDGGTLKEFTAQTRDDVVDQMPFIKKRFLSYKDFTAASFENLFTAEEKKGMMKLSANYLSTAFIKNKGAGKFEIAALPAMAQYATVNGMVADDFNADGNLDICFATNDYSTEPGNGRYDALNGLLLKGDGNGGFAPLSMLQSGICISGNGKGLAKLKSSGAYLVAATQNRGPVQVYKNKMPVKIIPAAANDAFALLHLKNGKTQKLECYYGASFLSQSGRFFTVSDAVASVEIIDYKGSKRIVSTR